MEMKRFVAVLGVAGLAAGLGLAQEHKDTAAKAGDVAKGKETAEQCQACHDMEAKEKKMGPALTGLYKKPKLANGAKVTDANVMKIINEGGNGMPAYADMLSDEERANLLAYLKTI